MDKKKYKIVIFGKDIYREYTLSNLESNIIKVGTTKGSHVRFNKDKFFENFEFEIIKNERGWELSCCNSVYFTVDGVMKLYNKSLIKNYNENNITCNNEKTFVKVTKTSNKYKYETSILCTQNRISMKNS